MMLVNIANFQPQFNQLIKATVQICGKISDVLFPNVLRTTGGPPCRHARLPAQRLLAHFKRKPARDWLRQWRRLGNEVHSHDCRNCQRVQSYNQF